MWKQAFSGANRVDISQAPLPFVAKKIATEESKPLLLVVPERRDAEELKRAIDFFSAKHGDAKRAVRTYLHQENSPFVELSPDRQSIMHQMATLHAISQQENGHIIATAAATVEKTISLAELKAATVQILAEDEIDREHVTRKLIDAGYLRTPTTEDEGNFSLRGSVLDVFPPASPHAFRVELDDWLVLSIRPFDPTTQRTLDGEISHFFCPPLSPIVLNKPNLERSKKHVRQRCDDINIPTQQAKALVEDLADGRIRYDLRALLPAFLEQPASLSEYLYPTNSKSTYRTVVIHPARCAENAEKVRQEAMADFDARTEQRKPTFRFNDYYLDPSELDQYWPDRQLSVVHDLAVLSSEQTKGYAGLSDTREGSVHRASVDSNDRLVQAAKQRITNLDPLAQVETLLTSRNDWRTVIAAHTQSQADRVLSLLKDDHPQIRLWQEERWPDDPDGIFVIHGDLWRGYADPSSKEQVITDEEIFGVQRSHRRKKGKRKRKNQEAFLSDLSELEIGDYVVHQDHGIGRYAGIQKLQTGLSAKARLEGKSAQDVEVLVIEYAKPDKLFLPVTRLALIQKFAAQNTRKPKLDKLGGSTFEKKKARVRKAVRKIADDLLVLYAERATRERDPLPPRDRLYQTFEASFPYEETDDQAQAIEDVMTDLEKPQPMDRLVCGDVGFGKTEVAMRAAFHNAIHGRQVAVLAPTTVLAQQHFHTFQERMKEYPIDVEVVSRFVPKEKQKETLAKTKSGQTEILIGTHRLLSKDVHFKDLGLLVIDEEQRFGVTHKERIKSLKKNVDVLTLSATPIPRTLQMSLGGLRDLSIIATPPVDRRAIKTYACRFDEQIIRDALERELSRGGQVFFVYNRVEGLYERADRLKKLLPSARIAVGHGQMNQGELEKVMTSFVEGQADILCATTIIESGLDIPRANTIIIDRADRFGLAQLYQIRGRVGRSKERGYCYLVTPPPNAMNEEARTRVAALERFTELGSGFQIASLDMQLRGIGDLLGAEQSGNVSLVGLDMFLHMLEEAISSLRGDEVTHAIDPELAFSTNFHIPGDYVDDVGLRLSFYRRLSTATTEDEVLSIAEEVEERFGPPPDDFRHLVSAMRLKPDLRLLRVLTCEATSTRVSLQMRDDTPLDQKALVEHVMKSGGDFRVSPEGKILKHYKSRETDSPMQAVENVRKLLSLLLQVFVHNSAKENQP